MLRQTPRRSRRRVRNVSGSCRFPAYVSRPPWAIVSERDARIPLHHAGSLGAQKLTESRVIKARLQPGEVRMVEGIKHVGPDLQFKVFVERKILGQC